MVPFQLLALVIYLGAENHAPVVDPIAAMMREMPRPDWLQRELRGAPPTTQASTNPPPSYAPPPPQQPPQPTSYVQGLLGVTELRIKDVNFDPGLGTFDSADDATMPLIGGEMQRVMTGEKLHLGVEGGFLMGWMGNVESVVAGPGGGALVVADNDVFMLEGSAGLYADVMLGDKLRVYGGAGGLVDWASVNFDYVTATNIYIHDYESGFGFGVYTRLGFDIPMASGMRIGFCWRWFESELDLGGGMNDMEIDGMQYMLTFTRSM